METTKTKDGLLGALFEILYGKEGDSWSQGDSSLGARGEILYGKEGDSWFQGANAPTPLTFDSTGLGVPH